MSAEEQMLRNGLVLALTTAMLTGVPGCGGGGREGGGGGSGGSRSGGRDGLGQSDSGTGGSGQAGTNGTGATGGVGAADAGTSAGGHDSPATGAAGATGSGGAAGTAGATGADRTWSWDGRKWTADGAPPACPVAFVFAPPVDFSAVTAVLYPGQTRGGNYKAHGGFLFASGTNAAVTVRAPMDGYIYRGARYVEAGEVQYLFDVINPCGIMYRFDHLLTLSPRFQTLAETLPPAGDSSATTQVARGERVTSGEIIATAVGFANTGNTSVDWGVYDLRQPNAASNDPTWAAAHPGEQAPYAICWLDAFTDSETTQLRALPGGDGVAGKMSDYCR